MKSSERPSERNGPKITERLKTWNNSVSKYSSGGCYDIGDISESQKHISSREISFAFNSLRPSDAYMRQ